MRYYPANRVKTNLKTTGGEFELNGVPYKGFYYETYEGEFYTGKDPIQGPSQKLTKPIIPGFNTDKPLRIVDGNEEYNTIANVNPQSLATYQTPQPFFPQPTDEDYARKSFVRYFAKRRGQKGYVIEVNQATHDSLRNADSVYDYVTYETISTLWQLVGPLYDDRTNKQYKIAGIIDTNKRLIEAKDPVFPGLIAFIGGEYAKFAKPTKK